MPIITFSLPVLPVDKVNSFNFHSVDLDDYALDELCQMSNNLMGLVSFYFHQGMNERASHVTLMCDKVMAEIKNRILYTVI